MQVLGWGFAGFEYDIDENSADLGARHGPGKHRKSKPFLLKISVVPEHRHESGEVLVVLALRTSSWRSRVP